MMKKLFVMLLLCMIIVTSVLVKKSRHEKCFSGACEKISVNS